MIQNNKIKIEVITKRKWLFFKDNKSVRLGSKDSSLLSWSSRGVKQIIDKRFFRVHNRSCDMPKDSKGVWNTCDLCPFVIENFECSLDVRFKLFLNSDITSFVNIKSVDISTYSEGITGKSNNFNLEHFKVLFVFCSPEPKCL